MACYVPNAGQRVFGSLHRNTAFFWRTLPTAHPHFNVKVMSILWNAWFSWTIMGMLTSSASTTVGYANRSSPCLTSYAVTGCISAMMPILSYLCSNPQASMTGPMNGLHTLTGICGGLPSRSCPPRTCRFPSSTALVTGPSLPTLPANGTTLPLPSASTNHSLVATTAMLHEQTTAMLTSSSGNTPLHHSLLIPASLPHILTGGAMPS